MDMLGIYSVPAGHYGSFGGKRPLACCCALLFDLHILDWIYVVLENKIHVIFCLL